MTATKTHRTRADRRPAPAPMSLADPVLGDHVDRIATGVRLAGQQTVHRRAGNGRPGCRIAENVPAHQLVRTTAPVDCHHVLCAARPGAGA